MCGAVNGRRNVWVVNGWKETTPHHASLNQASAQVACSLRLSACIDLPGREDSYRRGNKSSSSLSSSGGLACSTKPALCVDIATLRAKIQGTRTASHSTFENPVTTLTTEGVDIRRPAFSSGFQTQDVQCSVNFIRLPVYTLIDR